MKSRIHFFESKIFSLLSGAIVASAFVTFALAHWYAYQETGQWNLLLFCFSETLAAYFLLLRREPETVSCHNFDWFVGVVGTFTPLLFRPAPWGLLPLLKYAVIAGIVIQIAGLLSLNRSFAIVAAKRRIKTRGMYRIVRHPLYSSYIIIFSSYLLTNTSLHNVIIYLVLTPTIFIRCHKEESHLKFDPEYVEYMKMVNYRFIPFVY